MKNFFFTILTLISYGTMLQAIDGDFGRRYSASSAILQEPLYLKPHGGKKEGCKNKNCKCNPCKCKDCKCGK